MLLSVRSGKIALIEVVLWWNGWVGREWFLKGWREGFLEWVSHGFQEGISLERRVFGNLGGKEFKVIWGSECERKENLGSLGLVKVRESGREWVLEAESLGGRECEKSETERDFTREWIWERVRKSQSELVWSDRSWRVLEGWSESLVSLRGMESGWEGWLVSHTGSESDSEWLWESGSLEGKESRRQCGVRTSSEKEWGILGSEEVSLGGSKS